MRAPLPAGLGMDPRPGRQGLLDQQGDQRDRLSHRQHRHVLRRPHPRLILRILRRSGRRRDGQHPRLVPPAPGRLPRRCVRVPHR